ncbi:MAG: hypothetical protein ABSF18_01715, partial [Gammaproteobacteria bacterium]
KAGLKVPSFTESVSLTGVINATQLFEEQAGFILSSAIKTANEAVAATTSAAVPSEATPAATIAAVPSTTPAAATTTAVPSTTTAAAEEPTRRLSLTSGSFIGGRPAPQPVKPGDESATPIHHAAASNIAAAAAAGNPNSDTPNSGNSEQHRHIGMGFKPGGNDNKT